MSTPALTRDSELALARRFASMSPGLFLFLAAFAYGNSVWSSHPLALVTFGGVLAASSYWHTVLVGAMHQRFSEAPAEWSARLRRSIYFSVGTWSAFGYWAGNTYLHGEYFLYFVLTATVAGVSTAAFSVDVQLTERALTILLAPVFAIEMVHGALRVESHGFVLAAMTVMALAFFIAIARKQHSAQQEQDALGGEFMADLDRAIGQEVRNPLLGISGMIALVLDGTLSAQQREYLEIAQDRLQALLTRVNEMSGMAAEPPAEVPTPQPVEAQAKVAEKQTEKSKVLA